MKKLLAVVIVLFTAACANTKALSHIVGDWYGASGTKDLTLLSDGTAIVRVGRDLVSSRWSYDSSSATIILGDDGRDGLRKRGEESETVPLRLHLNTARGVLYAPGHDNWRLSKKKANQSLEPTSGLRPAAAHL